MTPTTNPTPQDKGGEMHTPTPWEARLCAGDWIIRAAFVKDGCRITQFPALCTIASRPETNEANAKLIVKAVNSHSALTEETALLKERVRVLEAHVWDALVDLSALVRDPTKDAQPSDFPARPNNADRENLSTAFNSLRRARSALHTTPEVGG